MSKEIVRCWKITDPLHQVYHDNEWGIPLHDDRKLFEFLVLGGFQAGLTWHQILSKREAFREAFDSFDPKTVAQYNDEDFNRLLSDNRLIKNKQKIKSAMVNAKAFLQVQEEFGTFDAYVWQFVRGRPINTAFSDYHDAPAQTIESQTMSKDLQKRGFQFVGPIICYAFMQATGLVNDHGTNCFRHLEILKLQNVSATPVDMR
jgi:DNA-3-methyladenine glycosylase I